jgi:hypothetical protein
MSLLSTLRYGYEGAARFHNFSFLIQRGGKWCGAYSVSLPAQVQGFIYHL